MTKHHSMAWYFDRGLERNALLLDASNLDWFEFPLFSCVKDEIYRTLENSEEDIDWGYSYPGGKNILKDLIAQHERFIEQTNINRDDIVVVGNGVTGVLNFLTQILKNDIHDNNRRQILYPIPAYSGILKSLKHYDVDTIFIKTKEKDNFLPTYKAVKKSYTPETLAIILTNPANPVCKYIPQEELKKILSFCKEKDIYIIIDAIFEEAPSKNPQFVQSFKLLKNYKKLIKIKGFSKDTPQLGDLRLGWSICKNKKVNKKLLQLCEITNFSNSTFLEALASAEMKKRVSVDQRESGRSIKKYQLERSQYQNKVLSIIKDSVRFLQKQHVVERVFMPDAGNILFVKLNSCIKTRFGINNSHDLFIYILTHANILVTPGHVFGLNDTELWFRVTVSRSKKSFFNGLSKIIQLFDAEK